MSAVTEQQGTPSSGAGDPAQGKRSDLCFTLSVCKLALFPIAKCVLYLVRMRLALGHILL